MLVASCDHWLLSEFHHNDIQSKGTNLFVWPPSTSSSLLEGGGVFNSYAATIRTAVATLSPINATSPQAPHPHPTPPFYKRRVGKRLCFSNRWPSLLRTLCLPVFCTRKGEAGTWVGNPPTEVRGERGESVVINGDTSHPEHSAGKDRHVYI